MYRNQCANTHFSSQSTLKVQIYCNIPTQEELSEVKLGKECNNFHLFIEKYTFVAGHFSSVSSISLGTGRSTSRQPATSDCPNNRKVPFSLVILVNCKVYTIERCTAGSSVLCWCRATSLDRVHTIGRGKLSGPLSSAGAELRV